MVKVDKKEARKNEILNDSIKIMYLKGYNDTSVNDIAKAAKMPKGSFYNYFKDKEQYAVDAITYYHNFVAKEKLDILKNKEIDPYNRIRLFFEKSIISLVENGFKLGCFVGNLAQEMGDVSEPISEEICNFYKKIVLLIFENLKEGNNGNEEKNGVHLKELASFIISGWQGSLLRMKAERERSSLDEFMLVLNKFLLK